MSTSPEIAWAAGLFEGEGSIVPVRGKLYPRLALYNTDREIVERFAEIVGGGTIYVVDRARRQRLYQWQMAGSDGTARVISMLWPWLSERRRARWNELQSARADHESDACRERECPGCGELFRPRGYFTTARIQKWCSKRCRDRNRSRLGLA